MRYYTIFKLKTKHWLAFLLTIHVWCIRQNVLFYIFLKVATKMKWFSCVIYKIKAVILLSILKKKSCRLLHESKKPSHVHHDVFGYSILHQFTGNTHEIILQFVLCHTTFKTHLVMHDTDTFLSAISTHCETCWGHRKTHYDLITRAGLRLYQLLVLYIYSEYFIPKPCTWRMKQKVHFNIYHVYPIRRTAPNRSPPPPIVNSYMCSWQNHRYKIQDLFSKTSTIKHYIQYNFWYTSFF